MNDSTLENKFNQLEEENKRLRVAVEELSVLNDIATAITSTKSLENIVDLIVQKCVKHINVEQGAVMLLDEKDVENPFHTMIRKQDSVIRGLPYRLDTQLTGWMMKNKAPLRINDFGNDERFNWLAEKDIPIHSLLSVPLILKGKMVGIITVFNKRNHADFSADDQRLLSIIAAQSAHVIENARLYEEEQALLRFQEEMRLARDIQLNLLPATIPEIPGYQISGKTIPAKDVGGDYYDFIPLDENTLAFCLGDVSGKGIPAALLMANLQATLRNQSKAGTCCRDCITKANTFLFQSTDSKKFATLFYGILNFKENEFVYCNAGHDNPFLFSANDEPVRLQAGGIVLGFIPEYNFAEEKVPFPPGGLLVIYSDGITEAMNSREEEFGESRLAEIISRNGDRSAEQIASAILDEIDTYVGDIPPMDDKTIVVIKREP
ncbi:MAG: SpoIIE family protein phosphatase [Calditrichia bacterium]